MSNNNTEDNTPHPLAEPEGDARTTRKKVSTKAPAKTASKVAAKKATTKKVAAKKTPGKKVAAKKAASKKAATDATMPELPFDIAPAPVPAPAAEKPSPKTRAPRAKKIAAPIPTEQPSPPIHDPVTPKPAPRKFGRVPGGGPVTQREPQNEEPHSQTLPSTPQPSAPQRDPETADSPARNQGGPPPQRNFQQRDGQGQQHQGNPPRDTRSKRRRDKRKRRQQDTNIQGGQNSQQTQPHHQNRQRHEGGRPPANQFEQEDRRAIQLDGPKIEANGMLELAPKGFGFLRVPTKNFEQARDDVFVTPETIRKFNLRLGQWIRGFYQEGPRGPQLVEITTINDMPPEQAAKLPHFDELKAINPTKRISFETTPERFTTRVVDIMAPVGRGQRGLIVSPPRSGKTTLLLHMAEAIREKYDEAIHLMIVLVDERPEEVTEFRRALPGAEIFASSNDEQPRNHCRIAELAIERAKRLVEAGKDVFLLMDSITRLARAYNGNMNNRGRGTGSGGITIGALEVPRRLFAAARNTRGGGSLTILATALIQTNSRADEAIYMEFKGTGNMELVLDRKIAENYIYPAVDIFKSGTRREELLLADHMLHKIHLIRRGLAGHRPAEAMERLLFFLKKFPNNPQMLLEIKG